MLFFKDFLSILFCCNRGSQWRRKSEKFWRRQKEKSQIQFTIHLTSYWDRFKRRNVSCLHAGRSQRGTRLLQNVPLEAWTICENNPMWVLVILHCTKCIWRNLKHLWVCSPLHPKSNSFLHAVSKKKAKAILGWSVYQTKIVLEHCIHTDMGKQRLMWLASPLTPSQ